MRRQVVIGTAIAAIGAFVVVLLIYNTNRSAPDTLAITSEYLVRPHSPTAGEENARVTIVEFFDPSCETCRAFYPLVKGILDDNPSDIRLVIRYAAFHEGSDEAVRIIEAARRQDLFLPVLEALLERQPDWAIHGAPDLDLAWTIAGSVGLDLPRARIDAASAEVTAVLAQDAADVIEANVRATPTFFVNGERLETFGAEPLVELIARKLAETN